MRSDLSDCSYTYIYIRTVGSYGLTRFKSKKLHQALHHSRIMKHFLFLIIVALHPLSSGSAEVCVFHKYSFFQVWSFSSKIWNCKKQTLFCEERSQIIFLTLRNNSQKKKISFWNGTLYWTFRQNICLKIDQKKKVFMAHYHYIILYMFFILKEEVSKFRSWGLT